jgi:hypothetical protein
VVSLTSSSGGYINGRNSANLELLIDKIGICCFSAKHPTLIRKSKDWLAAKQDNVSE